MVINAGRMEQQPSGQLLPPPPPPVDNRDRRSLLAAAAAARSSNSASPSAVAEAGAPAAAAAASSTGAAAPSAATFVSPPLVRPPERPAGTGTAPSIPSLLDGNNETGGATAAASASAADDEPDPSSYGLRDFNCCISMGLPRNPVFLGTDTTRVFDWDMLLRGISAGETTTSNYRSHEFVDERVSNRSYHHPVTREAYLYPNVETNIHQVPQNIIDTITRIRERDDINEPPLDVQELHQRQEAQMSNRMQRWDEDRRRCVVLGHFGGSVEAEEARRRVEAEAEVAHDDESEIQLDDDPFSYSNHLRNQRRSRRLPSYEYSDDEEPSPRRRRVSSSDDDDSDDDILNEQLPFRRTAAAGPPPDPQANIPPPPPPAQAGTSTSTSASAAPVPAPAAAARGSTGTTGTSTAGATGSSSAAAADAGDAGAGADAAAASADCTCQACRGTNVRMGLGDFIRVPPCPTREAALATILQLAQSHADGFIGTLGHNKRTRWLTNTIDAFLAPGGPLSGFRPLQAARLQSLLATAERHVRSTYYQGGHSADQSGAQGENIPLYASLFLQYFEATTSAPSRNAQQEASRVANRQIERSLTGAQPPVGPNGAELLNETDTSHVRGTPRSQVIGEVEVERRPAAAEDEVTSAAADGAAAARGNRRPRSTVLAFTTRSTSVEY